MAFPSVSVYVSFKAKQTQEERKKTSEVSERDVTWFWVNIGVEDFREAEVRER